MQKTPRPIAEFLAGPLAARADRRSAMRARLAPVWIKAVGEDLARHSQAVGFEQGRLTVQVDGPVWAHRLRTEQRSLLGRLQDALPEPVREMAVRVVPADPIPQRAQVTVMRELAPRSRALIDAVAGEIADEDLRHALQRLAGPRD